MPAPNLITIENMIIFTELKPINNETTIWETMALFNFKQNTYGIAGILNKKTSQNPSEKTVPKLFELFAKSPAQQISNNITHHKLLFKATNSKIESLVSKESHTTNLAWVVSLLESKIDTTIQAPGQKSLKDVLLEKKEMSDIID